MGALELDCLHHSIALHLRRYAETCTLASNGINKIFRCTAAGELYVRMVPEQHRSAGQLEIEMCSMKRLSDAGLPVCRVPNLDVDPTFGPVDCGGGQYNGFVTNAVRGRQLSSTVADNIALAKSLAKLHRASGTIDASDFPAAPHFEVHSISHPVFKELATDARKMRAEVSKDMAAARNGICHGDAWQGNAIYSQGEAVLIDFECHHFGPVIFDVATQLWWLRSGGLENRERCSHAFVEEYTKQSGIAISTSELRFQILTRELQHLHQIERLDLQAGLEDVIADRTRDILQWVQKQELVG